MRPGQPGPGPEYWLSEVGLAEWAYIRAERLSGGQRRQLEVARAASGGARLILLDEPAAGLSPSEIAELARVIRRLSATGITVMLVEHHTDMVFDLCDRITVLDAGNGNRRWSVN